MPTRIRLQRKGKKGRPFYHLVIADGRAPRDGKYIERIGTYNPLTNPAEINIDSERAIYWLQVRAQPSDTVRNLLSVKGILLKNHLLIGVKKGAISQEQADVKFSAWLQEKEQKRQNIVKADENAQREDRKAKIAAEKKINEDRAAVLAKRAAEEAAKKEAEEAAARKAAEEAQASAEEITSEETAPEAPAAE